MAGAGRLAWTIAGALAATGMIAVLLLRPGPPGFGELLAEAVEAERKASFRDRTIQVTYRELVYFRPAKIARGSPIYAAMRERFESAGYAWDDPLTVSAFAAWRRRLKQKKDTIEQEHGGFRLVTRTRKAPLAEVSMALRGSGLRAGDVRFRFYDGLELQLHEVAGDQSGRGRETYGRTPPIEDVHPPPGFADEVRILAAIHAIGADLGENVEVRRVNQDIEVIAAGLEPEREQDLRAALVDFPRVELRVQGPREDAIEARAPGAAGEYSETLVARARALESLARRATPDRENELGARDRELLGLLVNDHLEALKRSAAELPLLLGVYSVPAADAASCPAWQECARETLARVRELDAAISGGGPRPQDNPRIRGALARFEAQVASWTAGLR